MGNTEERLARHLAFWRGDAVDRPLVGFQIGSYFCFQRYQAAQKLLNYQGPILPDMIDPRDYVDDYERQYQEACATGQDAFYVAEPFTAVPWMEAMLGCSVRVGEESMWAEPYADNWDKVKDVRFDPQNPWFLKFMEFVEVLSKNSRGRFPVGQPILRGASDIVGAIIGQSRLPLEAYDHPDQVRRLAQVATEALIQMVDALQQAVSRFHGGYSIGFYHLWCPDRCIWFQEDLSALLSPPLYESLVKPENQRTCRYAPYSLVHLHPSSFFLLDQFLDILELKVVQINKDVGGPSVEAMLPQFRRVLDAGKKLVIWGALDQADVEVVRQELPSRNLYLQIVTENVEQAQELMQLIKAVYGR